MRNYKILEINERLGKVCVCVCVCVFCVTE